MRLPKHIGIIPDGNRRYAVAKGLTKDQGYQSGLDPGLMVFKLCQQQGIKEITYYGFTVDNTKRPSYQTQAFTKACVEAAEMLSKEDAELLVLGNYESKMFPSELKHLTSRTKFGNGGIKVNLLVNYGWEWDLNNITRLDSTKDTISNAIKSNDISRIDLIIRWGGRRRLSGFLPVQSIYSDFYVVDDFWPDFKTEHFFDALDWYNTQDVTLGG